MLARLAVRKFWKSFLRRDSPQKHGKPDKNIPNLVWYRKELIALRWENGFPRLVVHSKYEHRIKWTLRILAAIGILDSLVALDPITGLTLGVGLFLIEQFFERAIFRYTTLLVTGLPELQVRHEDILGMTFGWPQEENPDVLDIMGFCFPNEQLASRFFSYLRTLNDGKQEDREDYIKITFVFSKKAGRDGYYVCFYPNTKRPSIEQAFKQAQRAGYETHPGMEQHALIMTWTLVKHFGNAQMLRTFLARQRPERPFQLQAFEGNDPNQPRIIYAVEPILKWHCRVVDERDLRETELEYVLVAYTE